MHANANIAFWKKLIKSAVCGFVYYSGLLRLILLLKRLWTDNFLILTFHRVAGASELGRALSLPTLFVSETSFEGILRFVKKRFNVVSLGDVIGRLRRGERPQLNCLVITFDDGYHDFYARAYPLLRKYGLPATVYLTTGFVGTKNTFWWDRVFYSLRASATRSVPNLNGDYPGEVKRKLQDLYRQDPAMDRGILELVSALKQYGQGTINVVCDALFPGDEEQVFLNSNRMMSWDEAREMDPRIVTLGSHSHTHPILTHLTDLQLDDEMLSSKRELENQTQRTVESLAYPGGAFSHKVKLSLRKAGYISACTNSDGVNNRHTDLLQLRRINVWEEEVKGISGRFSQALFACKLIGLFNA